MEEQRHGGNVLADKNVVPPPQYHSNSSTQMLSAGVPCPSLPANWLSPMLLNRHKEHTCVPLWVPLTSVPVLCMGMPSPLLNPHYAVSASVLQ